MKTFRIILIAGIIALALYPLFNTKIQNAITVSFAQEEAQELADLSIECNGTDIYDKRGTGRVFKVMNDEITVSVVDFEPECAGAVTYRDKKGNIGMVFQENDLRDFVILHELTHITHNYLEKTNKKYRGRLSRDFDNELYAYTFTQIHYEVYFYLNHPDSY